MPVATELPAYFTRAGRITAHEEGTKKINHYLTLERSRAGPDGAWPAYNRSLDGSLEPSMQDAFLHVLPQEYQNQHFAMRQYIQDHFQHKAGNVVALEVGGPGSYVFQGSSFPDKFFSKSAGITLVDGRMTQDKYHDSDSNHTLIEHDITDREGTLSEINAWRNNDGIDLIIERMGKGLHQLPEDPFFLSKIFSDYYSLLNEDGVMFVQIPVVMEPFLPSWQEKVHEMSDGKIEIVATNESYGDWWVMRLNKHPGAPKKLPLLSFSETYKVFG